MFKRIHIATFGITVIIGSVAPARLNSGAAPAASIHSDCVDHHQPQLCTRVVEGLIAELGRFNEAFNPPDLDRLATFYHQDAVVFTRGRFFVGRDEIRNELLTPLVAGITGATVDISAFRFQVISDDSSEDVTRLETTSSFRSWPASLMPKSIRPPFTFVSLVRISSFYSARRRRWSRSGMEAK